MLLVFSGITKWTPVWQEEKMFDKLTLLLIALFCLVSVAGRATAAPMPQFGQDVPLEVEQQYESERPSGHRFRRRARSGSNAGVKTKIAGLSVAIWEPSSLKTGDAIPAPLVIFSHGFRGMNTQSRFLMKALARAGYLVIAPNHADAITNGITKKQISFTKIKDWSSDTYRDREEDIKTLLEALHRDSLWSSKIDWSRLALAGHSLGGYTVLGLAGAWPGWKLPGVRAVLALSPYTNPYLQQKTLAGIDVPVMYQSGTRDTWINLFVKNAAFNQTPSPSVYVEFSRANHFAWTDFNWSSKQEDLISHYCIAFLDKYVRAMDSADPEEKLSGVRTLKTK